MLKGETNCWSGSACGTPANGIHNHENGSTSWAKKLVHIFRSPCFFHAVLSEITPHRRNEFFGVGHDLILHCYQRSISKARAPHKALVKSQCERIAINSFGICPRSAPPC